MNFTKFDLTIIVVMSIAIISMSFVFPALGLTSASTTESDIPEFDMEPNRFDMIGDFPDNPGTPSQGQMEVMHQQGGDVTLHENSSYLVRLTATSGAGENITPTVRLQLYDAEGGAPEDEVNVSLDEVGDSYTFENQFDYTIEGEWLRTESEGTADETAIVTYEITSQPGGEGWLTRVPVVGGILDAGQALASIVGWIGSVIWWGIAFVFQLSINVLGMVFDVAVYFANTLSWLVNTYADVISSANAWAAVFVAIPGLLLFGEFGKIVMLLISLLPTT